MSLIEAIFLGVIQGMTEFFPISSSAHLKIARLLLGVEEDILFDLVSHSGTLMALIWFLRKEVWDWITDWKKIGFLTLASLPLIPAYLFLKPIRVILSQPQFLGYALMGTGTLLLASLKKSGGIENKKWQHVICIGVMQTAALIPGVSRSGSTIVAARWCGWNWREGATFSFLLAIPTILGGEVIEMGKQGFTFGGHFTTYLAGFLTSWGVGAIGVRFVFSIYEKGKVAPLGWYCIGLGVLSWALFHG